MNKQTVLTLTVNIEVWVGCGDEEVDIEKELIETMQELNYRHLEPYGGCMLREFHVEERDLDTYDYSKYYDTIDILNGRRRQ